jgi:hypothetical protein
MYASYESASLWPLLQAPPQGLQLDFVKAERSNFRWDARLGPRGPWLQTVGSRRKCDKSTRLQAGGGKLCASCTNQQPWPAPAACNKSCITPCQHGTALLQPLHSRMTAR